MFRGSKKTADLSTSASGLEPSFFDSMDMENPKKFANPIVDMPHGHEGYTEADKDKCPVMSGKIKPPAPEENEQEGDDDSDSSDEEEEAQMPSGHENYSEKDKEKCPAMSGKLRNPQDGSGQDEVQKKKKKKKIQSGCPFMPTGIEPF